MIALVQRVSSAAVHIDDRCHADIDSGVLILLGVRPADEPGNARHLADRVRAYRIFPDDAGRMNRDLAEAGGAAIVVPQFTLAADTRRGRRPGFSTAASPVLAEPLFELFCEALAGGEDAITVRRGVFGADMQVSLVNDGPVTFWLEG